MGFGMLSSWEKPRTGYKGHGEDESNEASGALVHVLYTWKAGDNTSYAYHRGFLNEIVLPLESP